MYFPFVEVVLVFVAEVCGADERRAGEDQGVDDEYTLVKLIS